jgi:GT2 family glycosyltransferase
VHVLAAGCLVGEDWTNAALSHFADKQVAAVVPWVWNAAEPNKLLATGISYHRSGRRHLVGRGAVGEGFQSPATVIGPAAFAAFYRQTVLELLGGFSTRLTLRQADADLALAIRHAGFRIAVERGSSVAAPVEVDAPQGTFSDALAEERLFWRNLEKASLGTLVSHAAIANWDYLRQLPRPGAFARLAGRAWANLEFGSHARHRLRLAELQAHATTAAPARDCLRIDASHRSPGRTDAPQSVRTRTG